MDLLDFDAQHIWHPYTGLPSSYAMYEVVQTDGVTITLKDGRRLIDGMASWWSAIHGYNHPKLLAALQTQAEQFPHVMFGGLTHAPAVQLAQQLVAITPENLGQVFFADSGSVAVEVAIKMALQYQHANAKPEKQRLLTIRGGYHGDTFGAMSVSDPDTGMHSLFSSRLAENIFVPRPSCTFGADWDPEAIRPLAETLAARQNEIAALILEPVVQGAGGMYFYHPQYLAEARALCDQHDVLLIADEIATGFGRTGKLFACEWAGISPDILCVGKALTGGTMTLAATLTSEAVSQTISQSSPHVLMHGPTFMANPLACAVANASLALLFENDWQANVSRIEATLKQELEKCKELPQVADVRVLGAIGVVELHKPVDMKTIQPKFVEAGVWVRPFGKLVYVMPAYTMANDALAQLTGAIYQVCLATA